MKHNKVLGCLVWAIIGFVLVLDGSTNVMACSGKKNIPVKYNWAVERKKDWNIVTLRESKMKKYTMPKETARKGCYVQGGVITEKYYVVSNFCRDESNKNRVYFVNRKTNTVAKYFEGKYGHMNALNYKWGTNQVLVRSNMNFKDHCFAFGNKKSDFKEININACKTKRQADYGVPGYDVNGRLLKSLKGKERGRLTNQGEAVADGYGYTAGWDASCTDYGQIWTNKRNTNALFVFNAGERKLLKTYYLPSPLLEIEDVSVDGNGNVWLLYNRGYGVPGVFYKVNRADLNIPSLDAGRDGTQKTGLDDGAENDSKNSSSSGGKASDNTSNGNNDSTGTSSGGSAETIILNSNTIEDVLRLVMDVASIGVPIVGVVGIGWMGLEYLMAGGDEAKTRKAKQRLIEIVIGLVIYAVLFAIAKFFGIG